MAKLDLGNAEFLFHSDAFSGASLLVHQFSGLESLSRPFEFHIDLVCDDRHLDLEASIGKSACLTLRGRQFDGSRYSRHVHGVIERFTQVSAGIRQSRYQATLVPTIKPMAFTRNSRIFQKQSGPDATLRVLKDDKFPTDWVSTMLHCSYGARDYCVQYQESDLDFVQRLWEEEGIFYFFEHESDKDKLVLGDGSYAFSSLSTYGETQLRDKPHLHEECMFEFRAESSLRSGATVLRDFKFKQPALDMEATAQASSFADYKVYLFPGEYVDPEMGKRFAQIRLEELQCQKNRYIGASSVRAMLPGHQFSLTGHRRAACNQEYLIVSVEHRGTQPAALGEEGVDNQVASYQNRVECISAKVPFRPARATPRPSILGIQTAVVVGPPSEEIHCDDHGRVKVQFHWDREGKRDDNSSCWIRVSQPWGGTGQGGMFIPRVGQEVVIQFLEGDPDRPLIVGRVYNGENPVPHGLPESKNISTIRSASTPGGSGFNELRFDDTAGCEMVFCHAQKNQQEVIGHDHSIHVKNDQKHNIDGQRQSDIDKNDSLTVHGDQSLQVDGQRTHNVDQDETIKIGGNQSITVTGNHEQSISKGDSNHVVGDQDIIICGQRTSWIVHNSTETVGIKMDISVGTLLTANVGDTLVEMTKTTARVKASSKIILECGTSKLEMTPGNITLTSGGSTWTLAEDAATLDAKTITLHGRDALKLNGDNQVNVKGKTTEVSGNSATLTLTADAVLTGSVVKLNS